MESIRLAFRAMATRFEFLLPGVDAASLRAAGEEAMREIKRIEALCNFYSPSSELSRLNREAGAGPVRCSGTMMRLLVTCRDLHTATQGRFDPTVAPALAAWGIRNQGEMGSIPSEDTIERLKGRIGMQYVELDAKRQTVRFMKPDIQLDLGGIAKGWALDEARILLAESGVESALLHGGTSTALAIGSDEGNGLWKVAIEDPYVTSNTPSWLLTVPLQDGALSVSGVQGKSFLHDDGIQTLEFGHVIDPATGRAVSGPRLALAVNASAATCDAWSTALLAAPTDPVPEAIQGTAFLKTDSGWTVTAGTIHSSWTPAEQTFLPPTQPD